MYNLLIALLLTPPIALLTGVFVGSIETLCDWCDEKEEAAKRRRKATKKAREESKKAKEREKLWDMYTSLSQE